MIYCDVVYAVGCIMYYVQHNLTKRSENKNESLINSVNRMIFRTLTVLNEWCRRVVMNGVGSELCCTIVQYLKMFSV